MTTKPFYNSVFAMAYIVVIVSLLSFAQHFAAGPDNMLMPIGMLSMLVLSAAVMAYIFFYQPVLMLIEGKREQAVTFFMKTVAYFAIIAALMFFASIVVSRIAA